MSAAAVARERPIAFSPAMVRAVLERRKTQTRRLAKDVPTWAEEAGYTAFTPKGSISVRGSHPTHGPSESFIRSPFGVKGDRLWVREAWNTSVQLDDKNATQIAEACDEANYDRPWAPVLYQADGEEKNWEPIWGAPGRQRLGRFMPRWLSRITLEVTDLRVQRVGRIDEEDAQAEGMVFHDGRPTGHHGWRHDPGYGFVEGSARGAFFALWRLLHGDESLKSNPWCWAISFKIVQP